MTGLLSRSRSSRSLLLTGPCHQQHIAVNMRETENKKTHSTQRVDMLGKNQDEPTLRRFGRIGHSFTVSNTNPVQFTWCSITAWSCVSLASKIFTTTPGYQSDAHQLRGHSLQCSAARQACNYMHLPLGPQTDGLGIQPFQMVAEDIYLLFG